MSDAPSSRMSSDDSSVTVIKSSQREIEEKPQVGNETSKKDDTHIIYPLYPFYPRRDTVGIKEGIKKQSECPVFSPEVTFETPMDADVAMRLNSKLLNAIELRDNSEVKRLLYEASPNATCRYSHMSACHAAVLYNDDALHVLLEHKPYRDICDKNRQDKLGRTPLHLAAWAGNDLAVARLLEFPADLLYEDLKESPEAEEKIKVLRPRMGSLIDVPCKSYIVSDLPIAWTDNLDHYCGKLNQPVPEFSSGWTPLHVASYAAHHNTTRLLLAAGANPNSKDALGQTPLDVAGAACFSDSSHINVDKYVATITALIEYGGELNTVESPPGSYSALITAVELLSVEAVRCLLAVGAPVRHHKFNGTPLDEGTAIDLAASKGKIDILNEILSVRSAPNTINLNGSVISSVLYAIRTGNLNCVQTMVNAGASLSIRDYEEPINEDIKEFMKHCGLYSAEIVIDNQRNKTSELNMIVHATVAEANLEILKYLLDHDKNLVQLLDQKSTIIHLIPVELAPLYKKYDMFKFLFELKIAEGKKNILYYGFGILLKIAVYFQHEDMFIEILRQIPDISMTNKEERCPLIHVAIKYGNEHILMRLIKHGADLTLRDEVGRTAISLLMEHYSKPMEFIVKVFDRHIDYFSDPLNPTITIDYSVLVPERQELLTDEGEMRVLTALLKTDDNKGQRKLLTHPFVESFLFLKWKTFLPVFYIVIFIYSLFVLSLSVSIVSTFYHKDKNINVLDNIMWHPVIWQCIMLFTLCIVVAQEFLCTNLTTESWISRILTIEFWVKLGSYCFAVTTPFIVTIESPDTEWRRILATLTLVLAWMNMVLLLSKIPISGSYIQMFWMVFTKIIEVLLTFLFLIIMFSFCFMIQTHNQRSFDGPMAALVKTIVMLMSDLDYEGAIRKDKDNNISISIMLHDIFVIFLILAAIVMMNLMTSVAVNDVQELVLAGNYRKLETQVKFLNSLQILKERVGLNRFSWKKVPRIVKLELIEENKYYYNAYIRKAILKKAQELSDKTKTEEEASKIESKLDKIIQEFEKVLQVITLRPNISSEKEEENKNESKLDQIIQAIAMNEQNITKIESKLEKVRKRLRQIQNSI